MRIRWFFTVVAFAFASGCGVHSFGQDTIADRIEALEAELAQVHERAAEIEAEITTLRAVLIGGGQVIQEARSTDEEHDNRN